MGSEMCIRDRNTGGLQEVSVGRDQPPHCKGAGTGELAGSASGWRGGVNTDDLLPVVGKVDITRASSLVV